MSDRREGEGTERGRGVGDEEQWVREGGRRGGGGGGGGGAVKRN